MIVPEVIGRLKGLDLFAMVEGVAQLASLGNASPRATPAAFVFVDEEAAEENERLNGVLQRLHTDVGVILVTRDVSDATGGKAATDVDSLKRAVWGALVGWQPDSADDALTYVGGRLARARDGYVTFEMTFAAPVYLTDAEQED